MLNVSDVLDAKNKLERLDDSIDTYVKIDRLGRYAQLTLQFIEELYVLLKTGIKWYQLWRVMKVIKVVDRFIQNIRDVK